MRQGQSAQLSPGFWESGQSQVQSTVHLFIALSITVIFPRFEGFFFFFDECLSPTRREGTGRVPERQQKHGGPGGTRQRLP